MLVGAQVVVTPAGTDAAVNATVPVKPPLGWKRIVDGADCPPANDTLAGLAASEKSGEVTVVAAVAHGTNVPLVPGNERVLQHGFVALAGPVVARRPLEVVGTQHVA